MGGRVPNDRSKFEATFGVCDGPRRYAGRFTRTDAFDAAAIGRVGVTARPRVRFVARRARCQSLLLNVIRSDATGCFAVVE
jgi:hypothetical protein